MTTFKKPSKPYCGRCESGWVRVADPTARKLYNNLDATMMLRCNCRQGEKYWQHEKQLDPWKPAVIRPAKAPQRPKAGLKQ